MADSHESGTFSEGKRSNQVLNESVLVIRAQERDEQAFEVLHERYHSQINRYLIRKVGDDNAGDELAQEIFLKAWLKLPGLREPTRFINWLYRIARNRALDYQRHIQRFPQIPLDMYPDGGGERALTVAGPEEGVEQRELIRLALKQVTPTYRSCLILYVIEGLSQREIAERLKMKDTSVSKYISRGKEELRQNYLKLSEHGSAPLKEKEEKGVVDE
jgi:RNA polymerase sigma-70 factor (ECF subfamily)